MSGFSLDWLALREEADLAARDPALARRFAAALSQRAEGPLRLVDLAAGSGANCRALLPRLGGDQAWLLVDHDPALLAAQEACFTRWARRQGYPARSGGGPIRLTVGAAVWRIGGRPADLAGGCAMLDREPLDGVTTAAFFDLVSASWLDGFATWLGRRRLPLLAALTVDGRRVWQPALPEDAAVAEAFRRHQENDKGFGPALGGAAAAALADALAGQGFAVSTAPSDWRIDRRSPALLESLIAGEAEAARAARPDLAGPAAAWEGARRAQAAADTLSLTVGHRDVLALPAEI